MAQTQTKRFRSKNGMTGWISTMERAGWRLQGTPAVAGLGVGALREYVVTMEWPEQVPQAQPAGYTALERWLIESVQQLQNRVAELEAQRRAGVAA